MSGSYSRELLQTWAQQALKARTDGDPRWLDLVFALSMRTRLNLREVERRIQLQAAGIAP